MPGRADEFSVGVRKLFLGGRKASDAPWNLVILSPRRRKEGRIFSLSFFGRRNPRFHDESFRLFDREREREIERESCESLRDFSRKFRGKEECRKIET